MASSVFGIGVSGLNAANLGLSTTGHNIANVNTDGFSRQGIRQSAPYPQLAGSGFNGLGVKVDSIARVYDQFLTRAVEVAQTQSSYQSTRLSHLSEINNIVADPTAGVSPALQEFFASVQNMATNPANPPSRQAMLSSAQTLVNRFQVFTQRLNDQRSALNGEISNSVSNINSYAQQVGDLNNKIVVAQSSGQPPNDLLDQRDLLVKELNKLVKTTSLPLSDGSINLFVGNGQGLVIGSQTYALGAKPNPADPESISITYEQNGNSILLPDSLISGGQLGALLDYRNQSLDLARNSLERTALGLVETFNQQQKAGQDLNGNMGLNLFNLPRSNSVDFKVGANNIRITTPVNSIPNGDFAITVNGAGYDIKRLSDGVVSNIAGLPGSAFGMTIDAGPAALNLPTQSGFSFPPALGVVRPNAFNTGNASLSGSITNVGALTTSNYEFSFDGTNYALTRLSDNAKTTYSPAAVAQGITQDGFSFSVASGVMAGGDRFTIKPLEGVITGLSVRISDPKEIAAAASITASTAPGNTGSLKVTQPNVDAPSLSTTDSAVNPSLKNPITIQFTSANSFTVTDTATGSVSAAQAYVPGMTIPTDQMKGISPPVAPAPGPINGWSMKLDGIAATGDTINIGPNINGNADNRNALNLGKLQTTRVLENGSATYQESYGRMVATIGTQTNEATIMGKAQDKLLSSAVNSRDSVSAVNLDEEAANLLRYQQAYQASSKVIQIAQKAFDEIINLGR